jgi:hypothetical protein
MTVMAAGHAKRWSTVPVACCLLLLQIELAFINTIRPKACGSCGSLLDAVCLVKA